MILSLRQNIPTWFFTLLSQYPFHFSRHSCKSSFRIDIGCRIFLTLLTAVISVWVKKTKNRRYRETNLNLVYRLTDLDDGLFYKKSFHKTWRICLLVHCGYNSNTVYLLNQWSLIVDWINPWKSFCLCMCS